MGFPIELNSQLQRSILPSHQLIGKFSRRNSRPRSSSRCFLRAQPSVSRPAASSMRWPCSWSGSSRSWSWPSSSGGPRGSSAASRPCWGTPRRASSGRRRLPGWRGRAPPRGKAPSPAAFDCPESFSGLPTDLHASLPYSVSSASSPCSQSSHLL